MLEISVPVLTALLMALAGRDSHCARIPSLRASQDCAAERSIQGRSRATVSGRICIKGRRLRYSKADCIDPRACCAPHTTLFLASVATSRGVKISPPFPVCPVFAEALFVLGLDVLEDQNSGIHPPSANQALKSGRNILISGKLLRLETISSI